MSALLFPETVNDHSMLVLLMASEVGDFLRLPAVRRLIAQEVWIEKMRPFVETPDLLKAERQLLDRWKIERQELHDQAETKARTSLTEWGFGPEGNPVHKDRLLLRMAAYRRLDSWHVGQDKTSDRAHALAGELYLNVKIPGSDRPFKAGMCNFSFYSADPRKDEEVKGFFKNEDVVQAIEFSLFPLAGRGGLTNPSHWTDIRTQWRNALPLRKLEEQTRRGAFPQGLYFFEPPADIIPRVDINFIRSVGQEAIHQAGLCPWWPKITDDFYAEQQTLFAPDANEEMLRNWCARIYLSRRPNRSP